MAKPPITRTLRAQDYIPLGTEEGLAKGLTELVRALNSHIGSVSAALSGQLTLQDNARAQWHSTSVLSVADDWTTVGAADLVNGFTLYDHINYPVRYRRLPDGQAQLDGLVTVPAGPPAASTPILALPSSYAPGLDNTVLPCTSNDAFSTFRIRNDGVVITGFTALTAGHWYQLRGQWVPSDRFLTPGAPWPYDFAVDFPDAGKPLGVFLAEAREQSGQIRAISLGPVDWAFVSDATSNRIRVLNVPGLTPGKSYVFTFLVLWS